MDFKGKTVVLTGASGGIGKDLAIGFAKNKANLCICARTLDKLNAVADECRNLGVDVLAVQCDVSEEQQILNFWSEIGKKYKTVNVLINNAVSSDSSIPFENQTLESLDKAIKSGLYATWTMMQQAFPYMKENGGSIINFGSSASNGQYGLSSYGACKAAICALTRAVAIEWGQYNIRVNNLKPFAITSNMQYLPKETFDMIESNMKTATAVKRTGTPENDILPIALFLASDESSWMTGQDFKAEGGVDIHE